LTGKRKEFFAKYGNIPKYIENGRAIEGKLEDVQGKLRAKLLD
jgi:hypothetical protein